MKSITNYIFEKIKDLPDSVKGLIVFDIDDTILKVDSSMMSIYKKEPGKSEIKLSTLDNFTVSKISLRILNVLLYPIFYSILFNICSYITLSLSNLILSISYQLFF